MRQSMVVRDVADWLCFSPSQMTFSNSSGGLVSALGGCEMESRWIGWPGAEVKRAADRETVRNKLDEQNCVPVFLTQKVSCDNQARTQFLHQASSRFLSC